MIAVQAELAKDPTKGKVIQGTDGLRKIRMAARGKGKRGGARVIYYFVLIELLGFRRPRLKL